MRKVNFKELINLKIGTKFKVDEKYERIQNKELNKGEIISRSNSIKQKQTQILRRKILKTIKWKTGDKNKKKDTGSWLNKKYYTKVKTLKCRTKLRK